MAEANKVIESKLKNLLESYAEKVTRLENEYWNRLHEIDEKEQDGLLSWEEADEERDQLDLEHEDKLAALDEEMASAIENTAKKHGLELIGPLWEAVDSHTYASGMGWSHTSCIYSVCSVKLPRSRVREYKAEFVESKVYGSYRFRFEKLWSEESPLITPETTPFTYKVTQLVPWDLIRPTWEHQVIKYINQLAEAEIEDRLEKGIKEVKASLEPSLWVYDFQHLYNAIEKAESMAKAMQP
ncbi:hypothetical protein J7L97_02580 [Candidatus Bathyarchaeota archaeon]|nr:hypothetical protein [Candidatus Bathyarchaeota archaeon]